MTISVLILNMKSRQVVQKYLLREESELFNKDNDRVVTSKQEKSFYSLTSYEKIVEEHLGEGEILWSLYYFKDALSCITNNRLLFFEKNEDLSLKMIIIPLSEIKIMTTSYLSPQRSIASIYHMNDVYNLKIESDRVAKYIKDILKHAYNYSKSKDNELIK